MGYKFKVWKKQTSKQANKQPNKQTNYVHILIDLVMSYTTKANLRDCLMLYTTQLFCTFVYNNVNLRLSVYFCQHEWLY